jgi:hypothetical protein
VVFQIFEYHGTNYAKCLREIKYKIVVAKTAFNKKTFHYKIEGRNSSKMLHLENSFVWFKTSTLRKLDQKYPETLECGAGKGCRI